VSALDFEKSLAVIIGIDKYCGGIAPLRTAVADARSIASLLEREHKYEVLSFLDGEAQLANLRELIQTTLPSLLPANSRLLLYFAGHGIAQDGDDGPAGYLIPQDAVPGDVSSYLSMVSLHDELTALPCRHFLAVFDCCFAGAFRWSSTRKITVVSDVIHRERYDRFRQDPAWQVITSASYDQPAMDVLSLRDERGEIAAKGDQQHSPFAAAFIEALRGKADSSPPAKDGKLAGDGVTTATELYLYLRDQVEVLTEGQSLRQTPEICTLRNHDKGEYIFLTPGHELNLPPAPTLSRENNPYRGLESFDQAHKDLFFGREIEIERLLKKLNEPHPMVVVLGASGTGKSSLVKAGLLPRLTNDPAYQVLTVMRPGIRPIESLSRACMQLVPADRFADGAKELNRQFLVDEQSLAQLISRWQQSHLDTKLLLVIDQAEELITQSHIQAESTQFQRLVKQAMAKHWQYLRVVATLRLDFEAQFQDEELRDEWMDSRFVIPPMGQAQLREAIEKPAAARVLYFEPSSLIDKLVEDVAQTPGALPLLSFTLSELYLCYLERRSDNRALTEADYRALGGVTGALTRRATQEYELLVSEDGAYEKTVKHAMLRMVALEGGELARRRVLLSELVYANEAENERVQKLLKHLIAARLVVRGQEGEGEPYVEPAHDALVRGWDKLLRWKNEERVNLGLQRELTPQAKNWLLEKQEGATKLSRGFLWDENPRLDLLKEVLNSPKNWLNAVEEKFIRRSIAWRRNRRNRLIFSLSGGIVALSGLSIFAFIQQGLAQQQAKTARLQASEAQASASEAFFLSRRPLEGMVAAVKAWQSLAPEDRKDDSVTLPVRTALIRGAYYGGSAFNQSLHYGFRQKNVLKGHNARVMSVAFSPDGNTIATAGKNGTVKLWNGQGVELNTFEGVGGSPLIYGDGSPLIYGDSDIAFSSEGSAIAASHNGTIELWDIQENELLSTLEALGGISAFSSDGNTIAVLDENGIELWDWRGGEAEVLEYISLNAIEDISSIRKLTLNSDSNLIALDIGAAIKILNRQGDVLKALPTSWSDQAMSATFSPDSNTVAVAGENKILLWDWQSGELKTLEGHDGRVESVAFSPDGNTIVSSGADNKIKLWDRDGNTPSYSSELDTLEDHSDWVESVAFSPDGNTLASVSSDNTVILWNRQNSLVKPLGNSSDSDLGGVGVSPDGKVLAFSEDNTIKWWNLQSQKLNTLDGYGKQVFFSPDTLTIASVNERNTIHLWNGQGNKLNTLKLNTLKGYNDTTSHGVVISPDGGRLLALVGSNNINLWNTEENEIETIEGHNVIVFAPDGHSFASSGNSGEIKLWDSQGNRINTLQGRQPSSYVSDLVFSPDGDILASVSDDTIELWDSQGNRINTIERDRSGVTIINDLVFSPDGDILALASGDGTIKLWDSQGIELRTLGSNTAKSFGRATTNGVGNIVFSPDENILAAGYEDGMIKLWDMQGNKLIDFRGYSYFASIIGFGPDGNTLISEGRGGSSLLDIWTLDPESLVDWHCDWLQDYLQSVPTDIAAEEEDDICQK